MKLTKIQKDLFAMNDENFRVFTAKLMPTVPFKTIIGVRTPDLRRYAKSFDETVSEDFLKKLPHKYYEENNLHAFLIEKIRDYDECIAELDRFLSFVDNWATCDMMRPKVLCKPKDKLIFDIKRWLKSKDTYTVRFALEMLMVHFLDRDFKEEYLYYVVSVKSDEYYIKMMQAWYFATALAKQYDSALEYIEERRLDPWVHNKTITKACESFRVLQSRKEYLKRLKDR